MGVPTFVPLPAYQDRATAFVDILGFGELIGRSETHPSTLGEVFTALREVLHTRPAWKDPTVRDQLWAETQTLFREAGRQPSREEHDALLDALHKRDFAITFSDNVVRSSPADWAGLVSVSFSVITLALRLLARGVFVRGGLTLGRLHHDESMVFGPALIEAYRIEQGVARVPRVAVSPAASRLLLTDQPSGARAGFDAKALIRVDADGVSHLDIFSRQAMAGAGFAGPSGGQMATLIRSQLAGKLRQYPNWTPPAQEKLRWVVNYFNGSISSNHGLQGVAPLKDLPW